MRRLIAALTALLLTVTATVAAARDTGFLDRSVTVDGAAHRFVVYVPAVRPAVGLPVILFLHGSGERGSDGLIETDVGLGHVIRTHPDRYPAVVVFPQAPADTTWGDDRRLALAALAQAEREFHTDPARVYVAGLLLGGNGAWVLANDDPKRFAAVVVVCGFAGPFHDYPGVVAGTPPDPYAALARAIAPLPAWTVHGGADPVVPVAESRAMAAALTAAGSEVRFRELPGVGHNAWDDAFADPDLPAWLFSHRRR